MKPKILIILGTRPEAIKLAPVFLKLNNDDFFETKVCSTSQHRQMLEQALGIFDIQPSYDLNIMKQGQNLFDVTENTLSKIKDVLKAFCPDIALVQGDTTTAFASSLACFYQKIKVGHVEAGLRTNNLLSPWPEELNRQMISRLSSWHFAPTEHNRNNLLKEGIDFDKITVTGNTSIDALLMISGKIESTINKKNIIIKNLLECNIPQQVLNSRYILITAHRRENFGQGITNICSALKCLAENNPDINFIYPVHLNPNVKIPVEKFLVPSKNIYLTKPLDYETFVYLMTKAYLVLTDSGGLQEEAPAFGKPVLVLRDNTERVESVEAGTAILVGTDCKKIIEETQLLIDNNKAYQSMVSGKNPYGDGNASAKILRVLKNYCMKQNLTKSKNE